MPLSEGEEAIWAGITSQMDDFAQREERVKDGVIEQAEKVRLDQMSDPFSITIGLKFDDGYLFMRLKPWLQTQERVDPCRPVLAQVEHISVDTPRISKAKMYQHIALVGPSIDGDARRDDMLAAVARNCNLGYRTIMLHEVDVRLLDPELAQTDNADLERARLEALAAEGFVQNSDGVVFEFIPSDEVYELPPVRNIKIPEKGEIDGF